MSEQIKHVSTRVNESEAKFGQDRPVLRNNKGHLMPGTAAVNPGGRPVSNWREWLRKNTKNGAEIHEILLEIARGQARTVTLLDGKQQVIVPTPDVRARVAIHLDEMLHGKAVTQNEQQRAEREASALQAVQALSDEQLELRAKAALLRGLPKDISDAELVEEGADPLVIQVWKANLSDSLDNS